MKAIINAELIMHNHYIPDAVLLIEDGYIKDFGRTKDIEIPKDAEIIDAEGLYVGPGFIDIHTHASGRIEFKDNPVDAARFALTHGTTSVLATLYFCLNKEQYLAAINRCRTAMKSGKAPNIRGIYMEGPYLNPKFGCDKVNNPWQGEIKSEDYQDIIDMGGEDVLVWALAPERPNIKNFVIDAKKANPAARFTVAHSEASPEQIEELMPYGLCIGTHHTNATGDRPRYSETRGVCVDEAVNYNSDIYAELICDRMGVHVCPYMLRLVRKIKGDDRIILISDAIEYDGPTPKGFEEATDLNFDYEGEIAGSNLTIDIACQNMMKHTGASLVDVFNYASYNPAKALGLTDIGEIAVGKRANLVFVDHKVNVKRVLLFGEDI